MWAVSRLYVTAPVGVTDQPDFHNAVVALDVPASPDPETGALELLTALKELERAFGRRHRRRWGPRELDLDILVFGRHHIAVERPASARSLDAATDPAKAARLLEVPHAAAATRLFVLAPLADLAPGLVPPGWGMSVKTALERQARRERPHAVRAVAAGDSATADWRPIQPRERVSTTVSIAAPSRPRSTRYARAPGRDDTTSTRSGPSNTSAAPSSAAYPAGRSPSATSW